MLHILINKVGPPHYPELDKRSTLLACELTEQRNPTSPVFYSWVWKANEGNGCINQVARDEPESIIMKKKKNLEETNPSFANREMKPQRLRMPCSCYQSGPDFCMVGISLLAVYQNMIF